MELTEAIKARHSVRAYQPKELSQEAIVQLKAKVEECNRLGDLHIQLIVNEPKAFQSRLAKYGKFSNVTNYLMMVGKKDSGERIGYYGQQIVLLAQTLGLNTCWVGLSYSKITGAFSINEGEKVYCCIAIGYGEAQGVSHKIKSVEEVSNADSSTPDWFKTGVEAALLAPTAINQQKFHFEYMAATDGKLPTVKAGKLFSLVGYTSIDLGIAKCNFELAAGKENFEWA